MKWLALYNRQMQVVWQAVALLHVLKRKWCRRRLWPSLRPISHNRTMQMTNRLKMSSPPSSASSRHPLALSRTITWRRLLQLYRTLCAKISNKRRFSSRIIPRSVLWHLQARSCQLVVTPLALISLALHHWSNMLHRISTFIIYSITRTPLSRTSRRTRWVAVSAPVSRSPSSPSIYRARRVGQDSTQEVHQATRWHPIRRISCISTLVEGSFTTIAVRPLPCPTSVISYCFISSKLANLKSILWPLMPSSIFS